jgi:hypothetical protein
MRKAGLMLAVVFAALGGGGVERALAQAEPEHCHGLRENMTVGGNNLQPTPEEIRRRMIEAGCPSPAASAEQAGKERKEVDQLYNELMKDSAGDLEQPPGSPTPAPSSNP